MRLHVARQFVVCFLGAAFFGVWAWLITKRRDVWMRYVSVEAAFWQRLHLSSPGLSAASHRFYASGIFTSLVWVIFWLFFALALFYVGLYCYWVHISHQMRGI